MLTPDTILDGKYRIVRLVGEGGMGAVYEGVHTLIHRRVAIKVLHPSVSDRSETVTRFEREAQAAGRIGSKHIVEVLDLGVLESGSRYLVMEYLQGESLSARLRARGRVEPAELVPIVCQLLEGVSAAHAAGIVHRDLKPDNIFLQQGERGGDFVKILDFGISKFSHLGDGSLSMTTTGAVMGTPYYMAPEQARGARQVDHRADLYAVGVILYECLSGKVPFDAGSFNELMFKIVLEEAPRLADVEPRIEPALAQIVERAMARDPERRYATAAALREALESWARAASLGPAWPQPSAPTLGATADALAALSAPPRTGTNDSWARSDSTIASQELFQPTQRSRRGLWAALAVAAVALVSGVVLVKSRLFTGAPVVTDRAFIAGGAPGTVTAARTGEAVAPPEEPKVQPSRDVAPVVEDPPEPQQPDTTPPAPETRTTPVRTPAAPRSPKSRPSARTEPTVAPKPEPALVAPTAAPKPEPSAPKAEPTNKVRIGDRPIRSSF